MKNLKFKGNERESSRCTRPRISQGRHPLERREFERRRRGFRQRRHWKRHICAHKNVPTHCRCHQTLPDFLFNILKIIKLAIHQSG